MKYVAYGSNLNVSQMKRRCKDAKLLYTGKIEDFALVFRGSKTGAYATIIERKGDTVPVAVWDISSDDEAALDVYEGYPTFYYKRIMDVRLRNGISTKAMAYIMFDEAEHGIPSERYIQTCEQGYKDMHFSTRILSHYIKRNALGE